jgi:hypothetical protein
MFTGAGQPTARCAYCTGVRTAHSTAVACRTHWCGLEQPNMTHLLWHICSSTSKEDMDGDQA